MDRQEFIQIVSDTMKLVRTEAGCTQDHMAELLGISKKTLIQIEKGRLQAGWTLAVAFCALFRDSAVLHSVLSNEPLEILSLLSFDHFDLPREKTMGGKVWWREIDRRGDFRLQQNLISQHFRILDSKDQRWCSSFDRDYISKRMQELCKSKDKR